MGFCYKLNEDRHFDIREECLDCKHCYIDELDYNGFYCELDDDECIFEKEE